MNELVVDRIKGLFRVKEEDQEKMLVAEGGVEVGGKVVDVLGAAAPGDETFLGEITRFIHQRGDSDSDSASDVAVVEVVDGDRAGLADEVGVVLRDHVEVAGVESRRRLGAIHDVFENLGQEAGGVTGDNFINYRRDAVGPTTGVAGFHDDLLHKVVPG